MQRSPQHKFASNPDLQTSAKSDLMVDDLNINLRKRREHILDGEILNIVETSLNEQLNTWKQSLDATITETIKNAVSVALETEMSKLSANINQTMQNFAIRMDEFQESVDYANNRQDLFEKRLKEVEVVTAAGSTVHSQITTLENKIDQLEQQARQFNIEIANLPEKNGENLMTLLSKIGTVIKHPINQADILSAHRVPHVDKKNPRPRNVIVKLSSKILRNNILTSARATKGLTSDMLMMAGSTRTIYINEHLTPKNKALFRQSREAAKKNNYKYVWVRHGTVLVRQTDTSPIYAVRSEDDIDKIKIKTSS
ncbi:uncharacterized protein LOC114352812 [Ostrinia furnacalis]|uniref:uncharacterized protein LOC114352812 n=1 Tax=Ostrinia furnacalis TaxID=93504 RepID=UPI00103DE82B|nr:uncharacterized protein LOC114352812 [Ostrinia furnacalis]